MLHDTDEGECIIHALSSHSFVQNGVQITDPIWIAERLSDGECMKLLINEIQFRNPDEESEKARQNAEAEQGGL